MSFVVPYIINIQSIIHFIVKICFPDLKYSYKLWNSNYRTDTIIVFQITTHSSKLMRPRADVLHATDKINNMAFIILTLVHSMSPWTLVETHFYLVTEVELSSIRRPYQRESHTRYRRSDGISSLVTNFICSATIVWLLYTRVDE